MTNGVAGGITTLQQDEELAGVGVQLLPIASIQIGEGRRTVGDVATLAASIAEVDLLCPITITEAYDLNGGRRRLEAFRHIGRTAIPALVLRLSGLRAELAQIDENLIRSGLTVLERGEHLARRKEVYEALYPQTRGGVAGGKARQGAANEIRSFADDTARKTGQSPRTIQQDVQIATQLTPQMKEAIRETPIAENKSNLLALARLSRDQQEEVAARLISGEATSVREALKGSAPANQVSRAAATNVGTSPASQPCDAESDEAMEACSQLLDAVRAWVRARKVTNPFSHDFDPNAPPQHWATRRLMACADEWVELEAAESPATPRMEALAGSAAGTR
jgi:ParB-like nuclease domain